MRLLASDSALVQATLNDGPIIPRDKDGTFHVDDLTGKSMVKSSQWAQVGTNLRTAQGYVCQSCGFVAVFKDRCGKCGGRSLVPETEG